MIKIQEHLNRVDAEDYLDSLALNLWDILNPKLKTGKAFKANSLIEKCKKYKAQNFPNDYLKKYAKDDLHMAKRQELFFEFLLADDAKELRHIILSKPEKLSAITVDIFKILKLTDLVSGNPGNYSQTPFGELLSNTIFDYSSFRSSDFCKELFVKIGFGSNTCPYCNNRKLDIVQIRSNSSTATKLKAYYDIDHFYSKSVNPFFAVSFYNLVPSCHDCNSAEKRNLPFTIVTHINPYYEAFDDIYEFEIPDKCLLGDPIDKITINPKGTKPNDMTVTDLKLEDRYQNNLEEANQLLNFFLNNWKQNIGTKNEQTFIDALFQLKRIPKERKDILNSLQGKMNRDILKQVDIHKILKIG